jgi:unsaturated rhamnogalacturonyl hydrolase
MPAAPTAIISSLSVYIIVDPDSRRSPSQPQPTHSEVVTNWVRGGGDARCSGQRRPICRIKNTNQLAKTGVQFTDQSVNLVQGSQFEQSKVDLTTGKRCFKRDPRPMWKELAVLVRAPAQPLV